MRIHPLDQAGFERLIIDADVIEDDGRPKVMRLPDGRFLKYVRVPVSDLRRVAAHADSPGPGER